MFKALVNNKNEYHIELTSKVQYPIVNNTIVEWNLATLPHNGFHIIKEHKSYKVEIIEAKPEDNLFVLTVNGRLYNVSLKDQYDELLLELGIYKLHNQKTPEVKAPMPGMVLELCVKEGATVNNGDSLLVLEAMKMENIIKAPFDGVIKKILVRKGSKVEKNGILLILE